MRDTLRGNVQDEPWLFGQPLYLESKSAESCDFAGKTALSTMWDTGKAS